MSPILAETDFPWIIVAMIFIAFFRWLMDRIKGVTPAEEDLPELLEPDSDEETLLAEEEAFERPARPLPLPPLPAPPPLPPLAASELPGVARRLQEYGVEVAPVASRRPSEIRHPVGTRVTASRQARSNRPMAPVSAKALRLDPRSFREGIVLKEILDRPLALRDEP